MVVNSSEPHESLNSFRAVAGLVNKFDGSYTSIIVFIATLLALRFLWAAFENLYNPLRDVPGPFLARWTRLWFLRELETYKFEKKNLVLHQKLGPIIRLGPDVYSIDDPEAAKIIYGMGANKQFDKSDFYSTQTEPYQETLFSSSTATVHAHIKRKLGYAYSTSNLLQYEPFVDTCTTLLLKSFDAFAASGASVDFAKWLQFYAFDVMGELTFSQRFGFLETGEDQHGLMEAIHTSLRYSVRFGLYAWLHPYAWKLKNLTASNGETYIVEFTKKHVGEHVASYEQRKSKGKTDFVQRWLDVHASNPDKMSMREIMIGAGQNIGAGADTTGGTLSAILYHLCRNPEVMQKLRAELEEAKGEGRLSEMATYQEVVQLPYLQAVLKEAGRLYTIASLFLPRVVPKGGITLVGRYFKEGLTVGINPYVANRNKEVFGQDADLFRPERWLVGKDEVRKMDHYYLTWGMGARSCIGKHIAFLGMSKTITMLIQRYEIRLENPEAELETVNQMITSVVTLRGYLTTRDS